MTKYKTVCPSQMRAIQDHVRMNASSLSPDTCKVSTAIGRVRVERAKYLVDLRDSTPF